MKVTAVTEPLSGLRDLISFCGLRAFRSRARVAGGDAHVSSVVMARRSVRFSTQVLLLQVVVLVVVCAAGLGLMALLLRKDLVDEYQQRALAIARSVAADQRYATEVASGDPGHSVQSRAEAVRRRTGALFVVVTDDRGIRYSHPDPDRIGQRVSTDPSEALAGNEVAAMQRGTLGLSARGKVPLRDEAGRVVGEVSVGIDAAEIDDRLFQLLRRAGAFVGVALALGTAGAVALTRRLKRQTFGLEPANLADLLREQEAVVHGVQDGVLAVDTSGLVTVCNDAARRLLGVELQPGEPIADAPLPSRLRDVFEGRRPVRGMLTVAADRVLVVTSHQVVHAGRDLGVVVTLRDRTDLDEMGRELEAVRALSDALRAQAHEHTNRLHTIGGLMRTGHADEALDYLGQLAADPLVVDTTDDGRLVDPYLRGLLIGKRAAASERRVDLRLADDAELHARLSAPLDVVTVLGNLVDNGIDAAERAARRPAWVEVSVVADRDALLIAVTDSGDGVVPDAVEQLFVDGYTTARDRARPHGIGLALARQVARRHGGEVELLRAVGEDHGAVFVARLPNVIEQAGLRVTP